MSMLDGRQGRVKFIRILVWIDDKLVTVILQLKLSVENQY